MTVCCANGECTVVTHSKTVDKYVQYEAKSFYLPEIWGIVKLMRIPAMAPQTSMQHSKTVTADSELSPGSDLFGIIRRLNQVLILLWSVHVTEARGPGHSTALLFPASYVLITKYSISCCTNCSMPITCSHSQSSQSNNVHTNQWKLLQLRFINFSRIINRWPSLPNCIQSNNVHIVHANVWKLIQFRLSVFLKKQFTWMSLPSKLTCRLTTRLQSRMKTQAHATNSLTHGSSWEEM